ncbi:hypothetical protein ACEPPN_011845 [Leptodophora sp. 'Broadleaf-Isolate-01']
MLDLQRGVDLDLSKLSDPGEMLAFYRGLPDLATCAQTGLAKSLGFNDRLSPFESDTLKTVKVIAVASLKK